MPLFVGGREQGVTELGVRRFRVDPKTGKVVETVRRSLRRNTAGTWPMHSWAAGVHPSQRKEAYDESVRVGVPTQFDANGDAIFTSRKHRKDYCKAKGLCDWNAGYGDPEPDNRWQKLIDEHAATHADEGYQ